MSFNFIQLKEVNSGSGEKWVIQSNQTRMYMYIYHRGDKNQCRNCRNSLNIHTRIRIGQIRSFTN